MKKLTLIITLLSVWAITNAQTDETSILSADVVEKNEIIMTPEIEEKLLEPIYWIFNNATDKDLSTYYGIKNRPQLESLHLGQPIPWYIIENEELKFTGNWQVPVLSDEEPLFFEVVASQYSGNYSFLSTANAKLIERIHNYEHKDLIIGTVGEYESHGMDYLIIRKEHKDILVQVYDEATGEYLKNEYSLSESINHLKELDLREKEARSRYYDKIADKSELKMTPEITEMVVSKVYSSFIDSPEWQLSNFGIKNRSQLGNLHLGKPIPMYRIENENLLFIGKWQVPVMSDGDPFFLAGVRLEDDEQYRNSGAGGAKLAELIHNYEYKNLIIGFLGVISHSGMDYLMIRKENKDIFVKVYNQETREYFKEYSLNDIINRTKE